MTNRTSGNRLTTYLNLLYNKRGISNQWIKCELLFIRDMEITGEPPKRN